MVVDLKLEISKLLISYWRLDPAKRFSGATGGCGPRLFSNSTSHDERVVPRLPNFVNSEAKITFGITRIFEACRSVKRLWVPQRRLDVQNSVLSFDACRDYKV